MNLDELAAIRAKLTANVRIARNIGAKHGALIAITYKHLGLIEAIKQAEKIGWTRDEAIGFLAVVDDITERLVEQSRPSGEPENHD